MFLPKNNVTNFNILESGLFQDIASKESKPIGHMSGLHILIILLHIVIKRI